MEYTFADLEIKEVKDRSFSGYGAVFNNIDRGGDRLLPDSLTDSIKSFMEGKRKPKMLWQHDPEQPIGIWKEMKADEKGLALRGEILDIPKGNEVYTLMKAGAIDALSIGYKTLDYEMKEENGSRIRELKKIELWEVSAVTFPMNAEALVTDVKQLQSPREVERLLRKAGVPGTFAKLLSLYGYEEATNRLQEDHRDDDVEAEAQKALSELMRAVKGLKETLNA